MEKNNKFLHCYFYGKLLKILQKIYRNIILNTIIRIK